MNETLFLKDTSPYSLSPEKKSDFLVAKMSDLMDHHAAGCPAYASVVANWRMQQSDAPMSLDSLPFLPVTVFKEYELRSTNTDAMAVRSSATTSGVSSNVFADKETRKRQSLSANYIWKDFLGSERRPYVVFDAEETVRGRSGMGARGAAIMSLAHLASEFLFVMRQTDQGLELDQDALQRACDRVAGNDFLGYGFTYVLYQAHQAIAEAGIELPEVGPQSHLMHSGGWKRLQQLAVDKEAFGSVVARPWNLEPTSVVDFYGLVEQVGVFYPDCAAGVKHLPYWAEIVIRETDTLDPVQVGETGLIQLMNCLPLAGPNHSVLTEDLGRLVGENGCPCGRFGRTFEFVGRAPRSEVRGCSDAAS